GRVHNMDVAFQGGMNVPTVEMIVTDDEGEEIPDLRYVWLDGYRILHIYGPFAFCRTYTVTIRAGAEDVVSTKLEEDIVLTTTIGLNPFDIDRSGSCTADAALSPVFHESSDALILPGDDMAAAHGLIEMDQADVEGSSMWYVNGQGSYTDAGRMARIPGFTESLAAGVAKLFWQEEQDPSGFLTMHYVLDVWDVYNPAGPAPTTTLLYDMEGYVREEVLGPYAAGELTGHDVQAVLLAGQITTTGNDLLQHVFLLLSPIAHGSDLSLEDTVVVERLAGSLGSVLGPFTPVGDLDLDGMDDLAAIHYKNVGQTTTDWQVWIAHGDKDAASIFDTSNREKIFGSAGREIVDIDAGDLNGDGASDLIVADVQRKVVGNRTRYVNPKISIFFGGARDLNGLSMDARDVMIRTDATYTVRIGVRAIGDINGDGFEDIGIGVTQKDDFGGVVSSVVYVFAGRDTWHNGYYLESRLSTPWAAKIVADGYSEIIWKDDFWDPAVGDVNNDGYYDFMIKALTADGYAAFLFTGGAWLDRDNTGIILEPDDAAAGWRFIMP
ncbi:MAG: hypothetical protein WC840_04120, partial [Candidatus Peribacteraceae bacterium]